MKNTNRIHKNRSAARREPQVKTSRNRRIQAGKGSVVSTETCGAEDGLPDLPHRGGIFSFFIQENDEYVASVPISPDQLFVLKINATNAGISLGKFVHQALSRACAEMEGKYDIRCKAEGMHQAASESKVLLELLGNHLDWRARYDFSGKRAETFNFGLEMLILFFYSRL